MIFLNKFIIFKFQDNISNIKKLKNILHFLKINKYYLIIIINKLYHLLNFKGGLNEN